MRDVALAEAAESASASIAAQATQIIFAKRMPGIQNSPEFRRRRTTLP